MSKSPNTSPKRLTQILLGTAGLVLVAGGGGALLINSQISAMQQTITDMENQVGTSEQVANKYQSTLDEYNATATKTHYLESSVSAKSFVPTLLKQLQGLATQTHLTVTAVRPGLITTPAPPKPAAAPADGAATDTADAGTRKPAAPYDTLDIGVDVKGSYVDTVAFLYGLTQFPKIVSVTSAQMTPGPADPAAKGPASPTVTTNLHLTAFVFHNDNAAPAPATGAAGSATVVSQAAGHAAAKAVGATRAANARTEVGVGTL